MPKGDRTGPWSRGPGTGRAMGYCAGFDRPGFMSYGPGSGRGWGRGFGRGMAGGPGRGMGFRGFAAPYAPGPFAPPPPEDEMKQLEFQADAIKQELTEIENRISELKKKDQQK